jgi:hypothetical protein
MPIATSNMAAGDQLARSWRMTPVVASSGHAEGPHRTTSGKPPDPGAVRGQQHHAVGQQGSEGDKRHRLIACRGEEMAQIFVRPDPAIPGLLMQRRSTPRQARAIA